LLKPVTSFPATRSEQSARWRSTSAAGPWQTAATTPPRSKTAAPRRSRLWLFGKSHIAPARRRRRRRRTGRGRRVPLPERRPASTGRRMVFSVTPGKQHHNPIRTVDSGLVATPLDSAIRPRGHSGTVGAPG
jgi:hypothetical protein